MYVGEYGETATATATATNRGRIVTRGDLHDGTVHFGYPRIWTADGVLAETGRDAGDAVAINERNSANDPQSGVIEVHGTGARGMWVWTIGTGEAKGINRGIITTHGDAFGGPGNYGSAAAGMAAQSSRGSATAINQQGAAIRTHGDGAPGLLADISGGAVGGGAGSRTARVENHGTIEVFGNSTLEIVDYGDEVLSLVSAGVEAVAATVGSGKATVLNTGNVMSGSLAVGLLAHDGGFGSEYGGYDEFESGAVDVEVRMTGGIIIAGRRDNPATPEEDSAPGYGIVAWTNSGAAKVTVSGPSTTVTAYGAQTDDPSIYSGDIGVGVIATGVDGENCQVPDGRCTSNTFVEISGGATVTADVAVRAFGTLNLYESRLNGRVEFDSEDGGYNDHFTIRDGSVHGDVNFRGLDDVLIIMGDSRITGDIDFGEGEDTLVLLGPGTLDTFVEGQITGLENIVMIPTAERAHVLPLLPAASGAQQGFVRVVNTSDEAGEVVVHAFDDAGTEYGPLTLAIGAGEVRHFNSRDLETGNAAKGLTGATGPGEGHWHLEFESDLGIRVMGYARAADGFLTSIHDEVAETVSDEGYRYEVVFFNPASNTNQVSVLRVVNRSDADAAVTITGLDDASEAGDGTVELTLSAGAARMLAAPELESGGDDLEGALGDGVGKWRLTVVSDRPVAVMSLLRSPTGHLTNLSTVPPASR